MDPYNFRERTFRKLVERVLGKARRFTPHGLRHTFASLHLARGTNLKWVQARGGWASAKVLLDTYGHFLPSESSGFADVLSGGTARHQAAPKAGAPRKRAPSRTSEWARQGSNLRPPACKAGALAD